MALNLTSLTREWIQYLKNNQIASTKSNPKTGKLNYNRNPNVQELIKFLELKTDFDEEAVRKAIKTVLSAGTSTSTSTPEPDNKPLALPGKSPEENLSTWQHTEVTPGDPVQRQQGAPLPPPEKQKKYSNDDAEDVEFKDTEPPGNKQSLAWDRKPRFKYSYKRKGLKEDFYDRQGSELGEKEIKEIFKILLEPTSQQETPAEKQPSDDEVVARKQEDLRKIKRMIRDTFTPQQRKSLWRLLNEV